MIDWFVATRIMHELLEFRNLPPGNREEYAVVRRRRSSVYCSTPTGCSRLAADKTIESKMKLTTTRGTEDVNLSRLKSSNCCSESRQVLPATTLQLLLSDKNGNSNSKITVIKNTIALFKKPTKIRQTTKTRQAENRPTENRLTKRGATKSNMQAPFACGLVIMILQLQAVALIASTSNEQSDNNAIITSTANYSSSSRLAPTANHNQQYYVNESIGDHPTTTPNKANKTVATTTSSTDKKEKQLLKSDRSPSNQSYLSNWMARQPTTPNDSNSVPSQGATNQPVHEFIYRSRSSLQVGKLARRRRSQSVDEFGVTSGEQALPAASVSFEAAFQGECNRDNNPCEHLCFDLHDGTYECACHSGHTLAIDGYSCTRAGPTVPLSPTMAPSVQVPATNPASVNIPAKTFTMTLANNAANNNQEDDNDNQARDNDKQQQQQTTTVRPATEEWHHQKPKWIEQQQKQLNQQQQQQTNAASSEKAENSDKMASQLEQVQDNSNNNNNWPATTRFNYRKQFSLTTATASGELEDKDIARIRLENDELLDEFKHLLYIEDQDDAANIESVAVLGRQKTTDMQSMLDHLRHYYQLSPPLSSNRPLSKQEQQQQQDKTRHNDGETSGVAISNNSNDVITDSDYVGASGTNNGHADITTAMGPNGEKLIARRHLSPSRGNNEISSNTTESVVVAPDALGDGDEDGDGGSGGAYSQQYRQEADEYERDLSQLLYKSTTTVKYNNQDMFRNNNLLPPPYQNSGQFIPSTLIAQNQTSNHINEIYDAIHQHQRARGPSSLKKQRFDSLPFRQTNTNMATCKEMPDCESGGVCVEEQTVRQNNNIFYNDFNSRQQTSARCRCPIGRGGQLCNKPVQVRIPNFRNESYLALPMIDDELLDELLIEFKPSLIHESLLLYTDLNEHFLALIMDSSGQIELRFHNAEDKSDDIISIRSLSQVKLLQWNKLMITSIEIDQLEEKLQDKFDKLDIVISLASLARSSEDDNNVSINPQRGYTRKKSKSPLILNYRSIVGTNKPEYDDNTRIKPKSFRPLNAEREYEQKVTLRQLFVGGSPNLTSVKRRLSVNSGFNGCVRQLKLNDRYYDFRSDNHGDSLDGFDIDECSNEGQL